MFLDLCVIKKHLNIDADYLDDDAYLVGLAEVAEKVVERHIDCELDKLVDKEGELPSPLLHAMLLFIGNLYANRESVAYTATSEVPKSYDYLLSLYRNYNNTQD